MPLILCWEIIRTSAKARKKNSRLRVLSKAQRYAIVYSGHSRGHQTKETTSQHGFCLDIMTLINAILHSCSSHICVSFFLSVRVSEYSDQHFSLLNQKNTTFFRGKLFSNLLGLVLTFNSTLWIIISRSYRRTYHTQNLSCLPLIHTAVVCVNPLRRSIRGTLSSL